MLLKIKKILEVKEERIGKFNLFLIGAISLIIVFSVGQFLTQRIIQIGKKNNLPEYQISNSIFLNQNSKTKDAEGTPSKPFKKISKALEFIQQNPAITNIYILPGKYQGILEIPQNVSLYAYHPETSIINTTLDDETLLLNGNNTIEGLLIQGGRYAVYIPEKAPNIKIKNCQIQEAGWYGIYNKKHPEINDQYKLEVTDSTISGNYKQGLYLQKGVFVMKNSVVKENGEEGVDLHLEMHSVITDSEISNNGEGGIETELGNMKLTVLNSKIENNKSSGINLQSNSNGAEVKIENNLINNNRNFGIRCALHSSISKPYFTKAFEKYPAQINTFKGNTASIDPNCKKY